MDDVKEAGANLRLLQPVVGRGADGTDREKPQDGTIGGKCGEMKMTASGRIGAVIGNRVIGHGIAEVLACQKGACRRGSLLVSAPIAAAGGNLRKPTDLTQRGRANLS